MKLRFSPTSPYVRKVTVTLIETGLEDRVERIPTSVWDPETDIATVNPLGKIPALVTDDGQVLFDSPVICEYLDSLHDGDKLFPAPGAPRWRALRLLALGDGMTDAGVLKLLESRRPEAFQYDKWAQRQGTVIGRAMDDRRRLLHRLAGLPLPGFGLARRPPRPRRVVRGLLRASVDDGDGAERGGVIPRGGRFDAPAGAREGAADQVVFS